MSLYARLAWDGIRKNKRLYLPYILTCVGAVTMYYMMRELRDSPLLESMKGGGSSRMILSLGTWVIAVFSALFLDERMSAVQMVGAACILGGAAFAELYKGKKRSGAV